MGRPAPPAFARRTIGIAAAVLVAALAVAWWRHAARPRSLADADPLAALPIDVAYATAIRLMNENHGLQSLPYFRHTRNGAAEVTMQFHYNYAGALFNSLFETDTLAGVTLPAWRTSDARVSVMRECLEEKLAAMRLAKTPKDRAFYANRIGRILQVWGFQWEAYVWYQQAAEADPSNPEYAAVAAGFMNVLRDPVHAPSVVPLDAGGLRR